MYPQCGPYERVIDNFVYGRTGDFGVPQGTAEFEEFGYDFPGFDADGSPCLEERGFGTFGLGIFLGFAFKLPSYSPDLNPDEILNSDLKQAISRKPESRRKGELANHAKAHMQSIQKRPEHIKSFFQKESVRYAS